MIQLLYISYKGLGGPYLALPTAQQDGSDHSRSYNHTWNAAEKKVFTIMMH